MLIWNSHREFIFESKNAFIVDCNYYCSTCFHLAFDFMRIATRYVKHIHHTDNLLTKFLTSFYLSLSTIFPLILWSCLSVAFYFIHKITTKQYWANSNTTDLILCFQHKFVMNKSTSQNEERIRLNYLQ